jgi:hypothetical protein
MLRFVLAAFLFSPISAFASSDSEELSNCVIKNACAIKTGKPTADNINSAFQKCAAGKDGTSIDTAYWQSQSLLSIQTKSGAMLFNLTCSGYEALKTKDENCDGAKDGGLAAKNASIGITQNALIDLYRTKGLDGFRCDTKDDEGLAYPRAGYISDSKGGCSRICPQDKILTIDAVTNIPQCSSCPAGLTLKDDWCQPPKCEKGLIYDTAQQTCVECLKGGTMDYKTHQCVPNADCSEWEQAGRKYQQTEGEVERLKSSLADDFKFMGCTGKRLKDSLQSYMTDTAAAYASAFAADSGLTPQLNQCNVPDIFKAPPKYKGDSTYKSVSSISGYSLPEYLRAECGGQGAADETPSMFSSISNPFLAAPQPLSIGNYDE